MEDPTSAIDSSTIPVNDREGRTGIGLCLSGGGFRAALFHLGALRRLHELGILQRVRWISAVSGGSIIAGHLAQCQVRHGRGGRLDFNSWQADVAEPFRCFAAQDLRTWPVLKHALWNWFAPNPLLDSLECRYGDRLTTLHLSALPELPEYLFCATDMTFGVNWVFSRARVGSYRTGYLFPNDGSPVAKAMTVAKAITASACFPPLFGPMRIINPRTTLPGNRGVRNQGVKLPESIALTDGGVYDNMAIEPVWKKAATLLVSDCGAPFAFIEGRAPWRTLLRYNAVLSRQTQSLRIRALQSAWKEDSRARVVDGTRWHLASGKSAKSPAWSEGYSEDLAKTLIAAIRTDLDNFSESEMSVLENHGYFNADYRIRHELPRLSSANVSSCRAPYPEWMSEERVAIELKSSHRRFMPSRLFKGLLRCF
jgi:NTE family protein